MESKLIKAMALYTIVIMMVMLALSVIITGEVKKTNKLYNTLEKEMEENSLLWDYIDNIDTYKSIDDAIEGKDNLKYTLQFLDE